MIRDNYYQRETVPPMSELCREINKVQIGKTSTEMTPPSRAEKRKQPLIPFRTKLDMVMVMRDYPQILEPSSSSFSPVNIKTTKYHQLDKYDIQMKSMFGSSSLLKLLPSQAFTSSSEEEEECPYTSTTCSQSTSVLQCPASQALDLIIESSSEQGSDDSISSTSLLFNKLCSTEELILEKTNNIKHNHRRRRHINQKSSSSSPFDLWSKMIDEKNGSSESSSTRKKKRNADDAENEYGFGDVSSSALLSSSSRKRRRQHGKNNTLLRRVERCMDISRVV